MTKPKQTVADQRHVEWVMRFKVETQPMSSGASRGEPASPILRGARVWQCYKLAGIGGRSDSKASEIGTECLLRSRKKLTSR